MQDSEQYTHSVSASAKIHIQNQMRLQLPRKGTHKLMAKSAIVSHKIK